MPLSNYSELRSAIKDWAERSSLDDALVKDFVALTEGIFNYGEKDSGGNWLTRPLRVRDMETTATVTVSSGEGPLPGGYLEAIKVKDPGSITRDIKYAPPDWLDENYPSGQDSTYPNFYTIIGSTLFCPISVGLTYYAEIDTVTESETGVNWLLTKAPNAYLYGGLVQYAIYNKNPEATAGYRSLMHAALNGLHGADLNSRAGAMVRRSGMPAF